MKRLMLFLAVVVAAAVLPQVALAETTAYNGVVVARSGKLLAVASPSGAVHTVQSSSRARIGARVRVSGSRVRVLGHARTAHVRGVVVRRTSRQLVLGSGRSLITVRTGGRSFSSLADHPSGTSAPGTTVDTTVSTSGGQLNLTSLSSTGQVVGSLQIQATVQAAAPGVIILNVNGKAMAFGVPPGIDLSGLVGHTITLTLNLTGINPVATPSGHNRDDNEDEDEDDDDHGDDDD